MAKKLFVTLLLVTMVIFSSISIYAYTIKPSEEAPIQIGEKAAGEVSETAVEIKASAIEAQEENYLKGLAAYIRSVNRNVAEDAALDMARHFVKYAEEYEVDEKIIMAIAQNESTYYKDAVSSENYKGLMQTGDGLARNAGYDPSQLYDPEISIKVGARYLRIKLDEFGDMHLALTAYNQGSGSVHSGNYSTGYADLAMARAQTMDDFLTENGYR